MTLVEMKAAYDAGQSIRQIMNNAGMQDADPEQLEKILSAKRRKNHRSTSRHSAPRRKRSAAAVLASQMGRAMGELVTRVNEGEAVVVADEIPFDGRPGDSSRVADDDYGLGAIA